MEGGGGWLQSPNYSFQFREGGSLFIEPTVQSQALDLDPALPSGAATLDKGAGL